MAPQSAEVYAEQSVTRRVKVFRGTVEELTSARRKGAGLRVFQGGSVGYAYTSDLSDELARRGRRDGARQCRRGRRRPRLGAARAHRRAGAGRRLRRRARASLRRRSASSWRWPSSGRPWTPTRASSPSTRRSMPTATPRCSSPTPVACAGSFREGHCYAYAYVLGEQDGQIETGLSFTVGRKPADLEPQRCGAEAAGPRGRAARGDQDQDDQDDRRARPLRVGLVLRRALVGAHRRGRPEGPLAVRRAPRRADRRVGRHSDRRRHPPRRPGERAVRRRGRALPTHASDRRRCAAGLSLQRPQRPPRRPRVNGQRRARLVPDHARRRADQPRALGAAGAARPSSSAASSTACS